MSQRKRSKGAAFSQVRRGALGFFRGVVVVRFVAFLIVVPQGDEDDDDDFSLSQTQTHSQVQRNLERRSRDEVNRKVRGRSPSCGGTA